MSQARNTRLAAWLPYYDDLVVDTSFSIPGCGCHDPYFAPC